MEKQSEGYLNSIPKFSTIFLTPKTFPKIEYVFTKWITMGDWRKCIHFVIGFDKC